VTYKLSRFKLFKGISQFHWHFLGCFCIPFGPGELAYMVCPGDRVRFVCEVDHPSLIWQWEDGTNFGLREYTLQHEQAELIGLTYDLTGVPGVTTTLIGVNSVLPRITSSLHFEVTRDFNATLLSCNQEHRVVSKFGKYCTSICHKSLFYAF